MHSLLKILESLVICRIITVLELETLVSVRRRALSLLGLNLSELSELSESNKTSAGLYFLFFMLRLMLSPNLDALTMRALLICPSRQYQSQIHLF